MILQQRVLPVYCKQSSRSTLILIALQESRLTVPKTKEFFTKKRLRDIAAPFKG